MQSLVIYDSNFGNTRAIAEAIAERISNWTALHVDEVTLDDVKDLDLIIVGSPINGWRPTGAIHDFLAKLPADSLKGVYAAAFDTRVKMIIAGNAAKQIAAQLERVGAVLIAPPVGFIVKDREGPLAEGELEKAGQWAEAFKTVLV
jgi:flavodoxin